MKSIRTKISLITLSAIIVTMLFGMLIGYIAVSRVGQSSASDVLLLMCESGQKNLNTYFGSVERSVAMVSSYAENDLLTTDPADLQEHVDRVNSVFARVAGRTNGILTITVSIPSIPLTSRASGSSTTEGAASSNMRSRILRLMRITMPRDLCGSTFRE